MRPFTRLSPFLFLLAINPAFAATFCVKDSQSFQLALDTALNNGENDNIRVQEGFYTPQSLLDFETSEAQSIVIEGGYQEDMGVACGNRVKRPNLTILDGSDVRPVLRIRQSGAVGDITIRDLTIQHGLAVDEIPALFLGGYAPWGGKLTVERVVIRANRSDYSSAAMYSGGNQAIIRDVAFVNNETLANHTAFIVASAPGPVPVALTNLTVTGNRVFPVGSAAYGLGLFGEGAEFVASNNILWGNAGTDLRMDNPGVSLANNDIGSYCCAPDSIVGGISVDPGFLSSDDYRLSGNSPARDVGINNPAGGTGFYDTNGEQRIVFGTVDMGAYEIQDELFANGFD